MTLHANESSAQWRRFTLSRNGGEWVIYYLGKIEIKRCFKKNNKGIRLRDKYTMIYCLHTMETVWSLKVGKIGISNRNLDSPSWFEILHQNQALILWFEIKYVAETWLTLSSDPGDLLSAWSTEDTFRSALILFAYIDPWWTGSTLYVRPQLVVRFHLHNQGFMVTIKDKWRNGHHILYTHAYKSTERNLSLFFLVFWTISE